MDMWFFNVCDAIALPALRFTTTGSRGGEGAPLLLPVMVAFYADYLLKVELPDVRIQVVMLD